MQTLSQWNYRQTDRQVAGELSYFGGISGIQNRHLTGSIGQTFLMITQTPEKTKQTARK